MTGTVKEYHWTQPHAFVILTVPKPSGAEEWNIEIGTPSVNAGMGWKMNDIKVGDTLTMTVHPVRTGAKHATASIVKLADGRTLYGPAAGLALVEALLTEPALRAYHLLPSVRAELLSRLGRHAEAAAEFERAADMTRNGREQTLLRERAAACRDAAGGI